MTAGTLRNNRALGTDSVHGGGIWLENAAANLADCLVEGNIARSDTTGFGRGGGVYVKLGAPALKDSDQDYYVFSEKESAQIVYDVAHKVVTISADFVGGIGAPDYRAVVGGELERTANGSLYRIVRYESLGFWVSYNHATGPVTSVTVTIQRM